MPSRTRASLCSTTASASSSSHCSRPHASSWLQGGWPKNCENRLLVAESGVLNGEDLDRLGPNARRLAIMLDGGRTYEFDIFNAEGKLDGGDFAKKMTDLATRIQVVVRTLEP